MYKYLLIIVILAISISLFPQTGKGKDVEQETVTFLESTNFNDVLQILEAFSWKYERKKIINLSSVNDAIGIPIHNLTWRKTLELITLKKGLIIEEKVGTIIVKYRELAAEQKVEEKAIEIQSEINTKQVRISAVAFVCDKAYLKSLGIDWSTLLDGKVKADINVETASFVPGNVMSVNASRSTGIGGQSIEINTLLKTIESNQLGTVIAKPTVVVSSGKKGYLQVGQDVSVKMVDDAGNTTDKFFATGVIMDVEPTVLISEDSIEVVHLITSVERSAATPGAVSTVINKSASRTDVILYNGEETVIGGLYDTDEIKIRSGIPFLKDLPWWVFGIRYLTGFYKIDKKERELVIIIKADILDDAITRMKNKK